MKPPSHCLTVALLLVVCNFSSTTAAVGDFSVGIEMPTQLPTTLAVENSLRELGIDYINFHIFTSVDSTNPAVAAVNNEMMALCRRLKLDFSFAVDIDPPDDIIQAALGQPGFQGLVFDELEHTRLLQTIFCIDPQRRNMLVENPTNLTTLEQAGTKATEGFARLRRKYSDLGATNCVSTHVWPVLLHNAARAGFIPCPKICKEMYSPVSMAIGLGAALQYERPFWVDCDLWYYDLLPGHPPEEFKSNLLFAYWMGAERVYVEGAGLNLLEQGRQGIPSTMMIQISPESAQLTAHGEVLRWFCREYLPHHPRTWTWRDVRPEIAIVRFEDTDHGQRYIGGGPGKLFGSPNLLSTPDTEAWLQIWNLLTHGTTGRDGITHFKHRISLTHEGRPSDMPRFFNSLYSHPVTASRHTFFTPLNGVVVFDDTVGYERLKDIPLLFLTGARVSEQTMKALRRAVGEGATCVAWGPLASKHGFEHWKEGCKIYPEGKGRFILTDDFENPALLPAIYNMLGSADAISYRFGTQRLTLRRGHSPNEINVEIGQPK